MKNMLRWTLLLGIAFSVALSGCKKDKEEEAPDQPELPPENAFVNDFSGFGEEQARSNEAYGFAALNVAVWNTLLYINLAIPVAAWHQVRLVEPEWDSELEAWVWTKTFSEGSESYTAELQGAINGGQVNWKMYLSREGGFQDFLWYEGTAELDITHGTWTLNRSPQDPQEYIGIEWNNTIDSELDDIKYSNIIPGDAGNGGYIYYGVTADADYEVFYDIYGIADDRLIEIRYNRTTTAGKVKDDVKFGDEAFHCWDEHHEDVTCP